MSISILSISALLLASCTAGPGSDGDGPSDGDADTDSDTDADSDSDSDTDVGATFEIVVPVDGATVYVDEAVVPCEENICTVTDGSDGRYEIEIEHDVYYFIPKEVEIEDGVASPSSMTWRPSSCETDPSWTEGWCDHWITSEYMFAVEGEYYDEEYPDDEFQIEPGHTDLDGDGIDEAYFDGLGIANVFFNSSGLNMIGYNLNDGTVGGYAIISEDYSTIETYVQREDETWLNSRLLRQ